MRVYDRRLTREGTIKPAEECHGLGIEHVLRAEQQCEGFEEILVSVHDVLVRAAWRAASSVSLEGEFETR
jgi:hypothetical protein